MLGKWDAHQETKDGGATGQSADERDRNHTGEQQPDGLDKARLAMRDFRERDPAPEAFDSAGDLS